jgi:hypothetical protein
MHWCSVGSFSASQFGQTHTEVTYHFLFFQRSLLSTEAGVDAGLLVALSESTISPKLPWELLTRPDPNRRDDAPVHVAIPGFDSGVLAVAN